MKSHKKILALLVIALFVISMVPMAMAAEEGKININTATVKQLVKLKKIGPKIAKRIIQYRKANGPFAKTADIVKVKGVGLKTYEANKDIITVK